MHKKGMDLYRRQQGVDIVEYSPTATALVSMDQAHSQTVTRKFEVAYMIAKQKLYFNKMRQFCELEEKHGVNLGEGCKDDNACAEHIAEDLQKHHKFFGFQADGSTDKATIEQELFKIKYFDPNVDDSMIHVRNQLLCVRELKRRDAASHYDCFKSAMEYLVGMSHWKTTLGTDGTAVNMEDGGLKGLDQEVNPWFFCFFCARHHHLALALKDSLKDTYFATTDEMLMRLYYSQLEKVCLELRMCL